MVDQKELTAKHCTNCRLKVAQTEEFMQQQCDANKTFTLRLRQRENRLDIIRPART